MSQTPFYCGKVGAELGGVRSQNMHKQTCIPQGTQLTERQESVSILHIYTQVAGFSTNFGFALEI